MTNTYSRYHMWTSSIDDVRAFFVIIMADVYYMMAWNGMHETIP